MESGAILLWVTLEFRTKTVAKLNSVRRGFLTTHTVHI